MNDAQTKRFNASMRGIDLVTSAQVGNGIDQCLDGTWTTVRLKQCAAWQRLPEAVKVELSGLVDAWMFAETGHKGSLSNVNAVYKAHSVGTSVIMPAKIVV